MSQFAMNRGMTHRPRVLPLCNTTGVDRSTQTDMHAGGADRSGRCLDREVKDGMEGAIVGKLYCLSNSGNGLLKRMNSENQSVPLEDAFVSYSQNFEDVMLWRALKHIKGGFYVDVGANDPVYDSVTKAFYDRGWTGINIEPCKSVYDRLTELRPKDINLKQLVGSSESQATFFEFSDTGRSTMDRDVAELFRAQGNEVQETSVAIKPLDQILDESSVQTIHFLKIDVEGAEKSVLEGALFTKHRPWVLVIESTIPGMPAHNHDTWEELVVTKDYEFVYDDGLNRFYVAIECTDLKGHFKYPPNFFDGFVSSAEIELRNRSEKLLNKNKKLRVRNEELIRALGRNGQSLLYKLRQIVRHPKKYIFNSK